MAVLAALKWKVDVDVSGVEDSRAAINLPRRCGDTQKKAPVYKLERR